MSDRTHAELLISDAYAKLSAVPKGSSQEFVSLASIGSYEVRMYLGRLVEPNGVRQFWLELIDQNTKRSVDSFICHQFKDAASIFGEFISRAACSSQISL
jgi:hypothetical protein